MKLFMAWQSNCEKITIHFRYLDTKGYFTYLQHRANLTVRGTFLVYINRAEVRINDTVKYHFRVPFKCEIISSATGSSTRSFSRKHGRANYVLTMI